MTLYRALANLDRAVLRLRAALVEDFFERPTGWVLIFGSGLAILIWSLVS